MLICEEKRELFYIFTIMIKTFFAVSDWAYRHAKPGYIAVLLLLMAVFNVLVFPAYINQIVPDGGPAVLDVRFGFSADDAYDILRAYGEEGRGKYLQMIALADTIYPLVYGLLLIFLASFFLKRITTASGEFRIVNLLAVDAVFFDFLENMGIMYMILRFPVRADFVAGMTSVFNILKYVMVLLAVILVVTSMIIFLFRTIRSRKR